MDRLPLAINDPLQIRVEDAESSPTYESRVQELAENELLIRWPTQAGDRIPVREHQVLTLIFVVNQAVCACEATVLDRMEDPVALLAIRPSSPLRAIQRRDYFRVRARAPVELKPLVVQLDNFRSSGSCNRHIRAETETLSGGGFEIHHHAPVPAGTLFLVSLSLPGERHPPVSLTARVVRCIPLEVAGDESPLFDIGFAFTKLSESARTRIVRFVFRVQRESINRD